MSEYLYLDIETLPTSDPEIIAEIATGIKPPGSMKKAETIEAWERDCKADAVKEAVAKTAFSGALGRIACIGFALGERIPGCFDTYNSETETDMLRRFFENAEANRNSRTITTVVGHHVVGFDIRFILQRCMVLGVQIPHWFPRDPKPWGDNVHDTMTMWAGSRDTISLDNLCKALGVRGKGDMTGADVAEAWARGEIERVVEYCMADVERVRACHRKMLVAFGELV